MNTDSSRYLQEELGRLKTFGWTPIDPDENGVRVFRVINENQISFPSEIYENDLSSKESQGIWADFRAKLIGELLEKYGVRVIWEVGAGHGNVAIPLQSMGVTTIPIEPLYSGAYILASRDFFVFGSTLEQLELPDSSLMAVGIFDVLEHLKNPNELLDEVYRVLAPGGILILSVPAYKWLYSNFDIEVGHFTRYSRKVLKNTLEKSQFNQIEVRNLFLSLIIPAFILRRVPYFLGLKHKRNKALAASQPKLFQKLEFLLRPIFRIESKVKLPFGLSIVCVSRK